MSQWSHMHCYNDKIYFIMNGIITTLYYNTDYNRFMALWIFAGTTRVSQYQNNGTQ